jgi:hypothetical protein
LTAKVYGRPVPQLCIKYKASMEDVTPWRLIVAPFEETMNSLLQQVNTSLV